MIDQNQTALLILIRRGLHVSAEPLPANTDFAVVSGDAKDQAMEAIALSGVDETVPIPAAVRADWLRNSAMRMAKANKVNAAQAVLTQAFASAHQPYVLLKGAGAAMHYPEPNLRAMGDIDVLIPDSQFSDAHQLLLSLGYTKIGGESDVDEAYIKNDVAVELHHKVSRFPTPQLQQIADDIFLPVFDTAVESTCCGKTFFCPNPALLGFVLLLHAQKHLSTNSLGLRQMCDFAMYCASDDMKKGEQALRQYCARMGLTTFLHVMVKLSVTAFGVDASRFSWCMDADDAVCDGVLESCFTNGNLGHKNDQELTLVGRSANLGKSRLKRALATIRAGAQNTMPVMRKHPSLLLFAPLCMGVRFLFRVCTGKRKLSNVRNAASHSIQHSRLERHLKIFDE